MTAAVARERTGGRLLVPCEDPQQRCGSASQVTGAQQGGAAGVPTPVPPGPALCSCRLSPSKLLLGVGLSFHSVWMVGWASHLDPEGLFLLPGVLAYHNPVSCSPL